MTPQAVVRNDFYHTTTRGVKTEKRVDRDLRDRASGPVAEVGRDLAPRSAALTTARNVHEQRARVVRMPTVGSVLDEREPGVADLELRLVPRERDVERLPGRD